MGASALRLERGTMTRKGGFAAAALAVAVLTTVSSSFSKTFDDAIDKGRVASAKEVRDASAEAGDAFDRGSAAEIEGRVQKARAAYEEAARLLPSSPHPLRRLCGVELQAGDKKAAVELCKAALAKRGDAVQKSALASALLADSVEALDKTEAQSLAEQAVQSDRVDAFSYLVLCQTSGANQSISGLDRCSKGLRRLDAPTPAGEDRDARAWSVFEGRRKLEQQLTAELVERVRTAVDLAA